MAHDPSSLPKFLVPEIGTSNFARVPYILVPDFSGTRNLGGVGQCSIRHQKLDARDPNAALSLAAQICIHMLHHTRSLSSANKLALLIFRNRHDNRTRAELMNAFFANATHATRV